MNHRKPRHELIGILRGHTPTPSDQGEEMVPLHGDMQGRQ